jgi:glycosyltransferase involved in cell wall biosynthesis
LNLPIKKKIILIDGQCTKHIWKGRKELQICLENLENEELLLLFFGDTDESFINKIGIDFKNFGGINNDDLLCNVYNSADLFLFPSIQDNCPLVLLEAISCGTPVVCFDATGPGEIIDHQANGHAATAFEPIDLVKGVKWVLSDEMRKKQLGINARLKVEKDFDMKNVSEKYIQLYESLLDKKKKNI